MLKQFAGPHPRFSDSLDPEWGSASNKFPGDAYAAGPSTTVGDHCSGLCLLAGALGLYSFILLMVDDLAVSTSLTPETMLQSASSLCLSLTHWV